jgi:multiple sugar transport system permease protein
MKTGTRQPRAGRFSRRTIHTAGGYLFLVPYLTIFTAFLLVPLGFGLMLSLYDWELLSIAPPKFVGLANYAEAFGDEMFWKALWATLRFVIMTVPLVTLSALGLALLLNAVPLQFQNTFRAGYFLPTIISIAVVGLVWRWFYNPDFGLFNALLAKAGAQPVPWITEPRFAMKSLVLVTLWWTVGGPMVILFAGLKQIPVQLYEAAAIDGATRPQMFTSVTLPQLRPVLLLVIVLNTIGSFQVFGQPFLITLGGPLLSTRVLVQYIYDVAFAWYRMGYGAAMSWLLFFVIMAFTFLHFRFMRER